MRFLLLWLPVVALGQTPSPEPPRTPGSTTAPKFTAEVRDVREVVDPIDLNEAGCATAYREGTQMARGEIEYAAPGAKVIGNLRGNSHLIRMNSCSFVAVGL